MVIQDITNQETDKLSSQFDKNINLSSCLRAILGLPPPLEFLKKKRETIFSNMATFTNIFRNKKKPTIIAFLLAIITKINRTK